MKWIQALFLLCITSWAFASGMIFSYYKEINTQKTVITPTPAPIVNIFAVPTIIPTSTHAPIKVPINSQKMGETVNLGNDLYSHSFNQDSRMGTPDEIFAAINSFRQSNGKNSLGFDQNLASWAQERANYFAAIGRMDAHVGFSAEFQTRTAQYNYQGMGENEEYGPPVLGVHLVEWIFAQDEPHKQGMLCQCDNMGVGVAQAKDGQYAVDVIFGER